MKFINDFKGKSIWVSLLPIFIALYLLFSMISISASQIFLSLSFIFWIIMLIKEKQKFIFPSFFWFLIAYTILSLVSSLLSVDPRVSLKDSKELLLFLIVPIAYIAFSDKNVLKKSNLVLLVSAYLNCIYSVYFFLFKANWPKEGVTGFMGHSMTQAGLLLLFCSMALSVFLFSKDKLRYFWAVGFFFSTIILSLTLVRSSWVGWVFATLLILFLYKPKTLIIIPIFFGLFIVAGPKIIKERALSIFSLEKGTNKSRIEYIKVGLRIIKDYPLWGTGPDTVEIVKQNPKYKASNGVKRGVHLHNNIIQTGAERGIPTLLIWLLFMIWTFLSLLKLINNKDPTIRLFSIAALAALVGFNIAGLFEYNFADSEITALFLYMITIPFALKRIQEKSQESAA